MEAGDPLDAQEQAPTNGPGNEPMITRFLFWNLGRSEPAVQLLPRLMAQYQVDVALLTELPEGFADTTVATLVDAPTGAYEAIFRPEGCRISALSRLGNRFAVARTDALFRHATIFRLDAAVTVVAAHLPSKREQDVWDQASRARRFSEWIRDYETNNAQHQDTLLVGDLNMNPFDPGMVLAEGLHAVLDRRVARLEERQVQGVTYPIFYNPMWQFWGDRTAGPPATFFRNASGHQENLYWHMLDQVLVRPALMNRLRDLQILDSVNGQTLLDGPYGKPTPSDHLPIVFALESP